MLLIGGVDYIFCVFCFVFLIVETFKVDLDKFFLAIIVIKSESSIKYLVLSRLLMLIYFLFWWILKAFLFAS